MPLPLVSLAAFLLACSGTAADSGVKECPPGSHLEDDGLCHLDEDSGSTGGALDASGGPAAPEWNAEEVLARLDTVMTKGMAQAPTIAALYESFMGHREPTCPHMEDPYSTVVYGVWQDDACVTADGWVFDGLAMYNGGCVPPDENKEAPGTGAIESGMLAQFAMTDPDGGTFFGGGSAVHSCRWYEDGSGFCFDQLGGSFGYPSDAAWLVGGAEASLFVEHLWGGDQGRVSTVIGGVGYADLDISFDQVVMNWDTCAGRPTGVLRLRDPTGYWHELRFADDCSGCGSMTWRDLDEGQHCPDLAGYLGPMFDAWESPCWH